MTKIDRVSNSRGITSLLGTAFVRCCAAMDIIKGPFTHYVDGMAGGIRYEVFGWTMPGWLGRLAVAFPVSFFGHLPGPGMWYTNGWVWAGPVMVGYSSAGWTLQWRTRK